MLNNENENDNYNKIKYHENSLSRNIELEKIINKPDLLSTNQNSNSSNIDVNTYLLHPKKNKKYNSNLNLNKDIERDFRDYSYNNINDNDNSDLNDKEKTFYTNYIYNGNKSHGRGIGNYDINSELRYGISCRNEKNNVRENDFSNLKLDNNNLFVNKLENTLPFPRGGIDTRNLDKMRIEN